MRDREGNKSRRGGEAAFHSRGTLIGHVDLNPYSPALSCHPAALFLLEALSEDSSVKTTSAERFILVDLIPGRD